MSEAAETRPYTVSALTTELKGVVEGRFTKIYVEAEISGWRVYPSGHAYFTLKDSGAQISAVMFAGQLSRCRARDGLKDGAKVIVYGNISIYAPRGQYQLVVMAAKLAGVGDLMQRYLELKARLEGEGLFDPAKKRPLPFMPRRIGIVTSEAGAVIHDMCTVLTRRFPAIEIRLFPALVQGAEAPRSLIAGLDYFDREKPDLVIIARGGGSFEDLFCFNDEELVRRVAAMSVPIVSAVGHETDFTLCDFAADKRAGTPSIAAEISVPVLAELRSSLAELSRSLVTSLRSRGEFYAQRLDRDADQLVAALKLSATRARQRLESMSARLSPAVRIAFTRVEGRLQRAGEALKHLSPYGVLDRGYSLVTAADGRAVRDAETLAVGDRLAIRFAKGSVAATVG